ncbi:GGDEF domain-containing protein [Rhizobium oryzicola]|uniref:diguanylate cyclase n=1 Tax=Rhizobium oryzicola TaxID=1232668 RepID=A0ABT8STP6_9HYPH|nr:GGDEF domain-containing protein [Rhizobium oryzicola]MDO1581814.1 GGDEF domain-containing protein [Rhizobium oryzicola]
MDIATALMLWSTEATTLAVLLLATWLHNRNLKEIGTWGAGFACHGIGVAMIGLRGIIPDFVSIHAGNILQLAGAGFWCAGLMIYDHKRLRPWLAAPALIWIVCMLFPDVRQEFWARIVVFQIAAGVGYGLLAFLLIEGQHTQRLTRILFSIVAVIQCCIALRMAIETIGLRPGNFKQLPNVVAFTVGNIFCLVCGIMLGARLLMSRTEETLRQLALVDPLTGVLNRRGLFEQFTEIRAKSTPARPLVAIVVFDLDHFKRINDVHGHSTGDEVLVSFSRLATDHIGKMGVFGRMGGEEFACILSVSSQSEASGVAEAIRMSLMHLEITTGAEHIKVQATVSAGLAIMPAAKAELEAMLMTADKALYAAKAAGRNRVALQATLCETPVANAPGLPDAFSLPPTAAAQEAASRYHEFGRGI